MWTSKNYFGFSREVLEEAIHQVDWDGTSHVKMTRRTPDEIEVQRVDNNGNLMKGHEHTMIYDKSDPEFKEITDKEDAAEAHNAWKEKVHAKRQGRHYHESYEDEIEELEKMTTAELKKYLDAKRKERNAK